MNFQLQIAIFVSLAFSGITGQNLQDVQDVLPLFFQDKITSEELKLLSKLRERVKPLLTQKVMFENGYLVRFLRTSNNDLEGAEEMIRKMYKWRQEFNVDNVENYTDFSSWYRTSPFKLVEDKSHRPGIIGGFKSMDLRKLIVAGKYNALRQYIIFILEKSALNLDRVSKLYGKQYSSGYLVFDMNGYSSTKFACLACISKWIELAVSYESYYPQLASHIIGINVPKIFQNLFSIVKPILSERSIKLIQAYGFDRSEWQPILLKYFDKDQLTKEFGGTGSYDVRFIQRDFFGSKNNTIDNRIL